MLPSIHAKMTRQALDERVSQRALRAIILGNLNQDNLRGQIGHDEYHFDNNAFEKSLAYMDGQRALCISSLKDHKPASAWAAFGRLTHAAQDFYAHSNYVTLWLARYDDAALPAPLEIDPVDARLVNGPNLRSGKTYYPQEALYFVPGMRKLALSILPLDSHAHMNLDSEASGPYFQFAFSAEVKRTQLEFNRLENSLSPDALALFECLQRREVTPA